MIERTAISYHEIGCARRFMVITEKNIIGNLVGTWAEVTELMALADRGRVELTTVEYSLADANRALHELNSGKIHGRAVMIR